VDVDDADHELFAADWTSSGAKLDAIDLHDSSKPVLFNLLADGVAHTFYFLFWADVAGQVQVDTVALWYAVGSCSTDAAAPPVCLQLSHTGMVQSRMWTTRQGSGSITARLGCADDTYVGLIGDTSGNGAKVILPLALVHGGLALRLFGTVAADINYLARAYFTLRSEQ